MFIRSGLGFLVPVTSILCLAVTEVAFDAVYGHLAIIGVVLLIYGAMT